MTIIVGLVTKAGVLMGADSAGVCGYELTIRKDKKIYQVDDFLFGYTTSFRMGQLLGYSFTDSCKFITQYSEIPASA